MINFLMPSRPWTPADDEEPDFPEVGEVLCVNSEDGERVVDIVADHGPARLYTVRDSDGKDHFVAMDGQGMFISINDPTDR